MSCSLPSSSWWARTGSDDRDAACRRAALSRARISTARWYPCCRPSPAVIIPVSVPARAVWSVTPSAIIPCIMAPGMRPPFALHHWRMAIVATVVLLMPVSSWPTTTHGTVWFHDMCGMRSGAWAEAVNRLARIKREKGRSRDARMMGSRNAAARMEPRAKGRAVHVMWRRGELLLRLAGRILVRERRKGPGSTFVGM